MVDEDRAEANRTLDICSLLKRRADFVVCVLAATRRSHLVCRCSNWAIRFAWVVCFRLGTGLVFNLPDQPFRFVRAASGLAQFAQPTRRRVAVYDSRPIQAGAASALRRLAICILDDAGDDDRAPALLDCDNGLHPVGNPV